MRVQNDHIVELFYSVKDENGNLMDSNAGFEPLAYLHGSGNIIPGLEQALTNATTGDKLSLVILPENGYGLRNEDLVQPFERAALEIDFPVEKAMTLEMQSPEGVAMHVTVVDVNESFVTLDANHPFAGKKLYYDVEILSVRAASVEEVKSGAPLKAATCGSNCACYNNLD